MQTIYLDSEGTPRQQLPLQHKIYNHQQDNKRVSHPLENVNKQSNCKGI